MENVIEFLKDSDKATVTFSQGRFIGRTLRLAEKFPEIEILKRPEENGGYLLAHIPVDFIKINPKKELSDEQRELLAERAKNNFFNYDTNADETGQKSIIDD